MDLISLFTGLGIGSLLSVALQYYFNERSKSKTLAFQEKKEAFIGLLNAYHQAAVRPSDENSKNFAYWQIRCELISTEQTRKAIAEIVKTNGLSEQRLVAHENLKICLRDELKKYF